MTSSSAEVGWIATVSSKLDFVAPIFTATANPWSISSQPIPIMWIPTICNYSHRQYHYSNNASSDHLSMKSTEITFRSSKQYITTVAHFCLHVAHNLPLPADVHNLSILRITVHLMAIWKLWDGEGRASAVNQQLVNSVRADFTKLTGC